MTNEQAERIALVLERIAAAQERIVKMMRKQRGC